MGKTLNIWDVPEDIHLKMKLLCAGQGISMASLLEKLIEKAWLEDKTVPDKSAKTKMKKIINRFGKK